MQKKLTERKTIHISHATSQQLNGLVFLLPWIIGFLLFFLTPIINTIIYSFNEVGVADAGGMSFKYVGLENYINLFTTEVSSKSQQFLRVLIDENTNIFVNTPLIVLFSLFSAILVNMNFKGRGIVRVIFFMPIVLGLKVVVNLTMVSTGGDILEASLSSAFDDQMVIGFLTSYTFLPREVMVFIVGIVNNIFQVISQAGVQTLIFLAGLQSINPSLYEVAKIEGATPYEVFWKITLPILSNITLFAFVYTFVDLFLASSISSEIFRFAFNRNNIGIGSALSVVYMINVLIDLGLLLLILSKVVKLGYENK